MLCQSNPVLQYPDLLGPVSILHILLVVGAATQTCQSLFLHVEMKMF
jgi:hypothetical protein